MREPLSVTHVVLKLDPGGLERVVLDLIREGIQLGHRPSVLCIESRGQLAETAEELGAQVLNVSKGKGLRIQTLRQVNRSLERLRPDVIHTHQIGALFYVGPVARRLGFPIIHTEHGKHFPATFRQNCLGRFAGSFAQRFLCVSREIADVIVEQKIAKRSRVGVQPNGIDTSTFIPTNDRAAARAALGFRPDAWILGTAGRLAEVKRYDRLISAFATLRGVRPNAELVFVGDGPLRGELEAQAVSLGLTDHVRFAGYQSDPRPYLQSFDAFSLTSRSEGMPLSVLEAWATGLPVVVPNVGGLPDMVENGVTGLLVDATVESNLVEAFRTLHDQPERARSLGEAGRDLARTCYDVRVMTESYDRYYRGAVEALGARV